MTSFSPRWLLLRLRFMQLQFEIVEEGLRATNWGKGELNA